MALGRIGGTKAAKALSQSLATAPEAVRPAVAAGLHPVRGEASSPRANAAEAVKLYDTVRVGERALATSSSKPSAGPSSRANPPACPCCWTQLRWPDKAMFGIGLRTARELPGRDVTEALAAELRRCSPDRQSFLLLAIGRPHR